MCRLRFERSCKRHAVALQLFRRDWDTDVVRKYLVSKLLKPGEVMHLLFEFSSAVHFLGQHKEVHWMPNIGNDSEFDLAVTTNGGQLVNVECTRKCERPERLAAPLLLVEEVKNTLTYKLGQASHATNASGSCHSFPREHRLGRVFRKAGLGGRS